MENKKKICITAQGKNLDAFLDPRFGRAVYFLFINNKGKLIKAIKNPGIEAIRGAGITAAQIVVDQKVEAVITGNVGPNAVRVLNSSGVKIFIASPGIKVADAFKEYQEGKLQEISESAYRPGFGRGRGCGFGRRI